MNYCIAQFILNEFNKKSVIFNYIEDMVKGFFVSTVISLQYKNTNIAHAKFKELNCYLENYIADSFSTKVSDKLKSHYQELLQIDLSDIE